MTNPTKRNMKQPSTGLAVDMLNPEARKIAFDVLPKLRPSVSYGLDDYHQTHLLWEATNRETNMLFRKHYGKYEDEWWWWNIQTWINHFSQLDDNVKQFGKDYSRDLVHLFLNEPKDITNRAEEYMDLVIGVLKWAKNNGFRLAFPIPNAEVEWKPLMEDGKFDRLLKAYDDEGFRAHGHIGFIHEYTMFHINEGLAAARSRPGWDHMWPDAFLHPDAMRPEMWATKEEVETLWQSNYTGCRGMRVNHRMMDTLQRDPIPLVSSEGEWDKTPHLEDWLDPRTNKRRNIYKEVLGRYQVKPNSPHMDFAGAASLEPLYRQMLTYIDWTKPGAFATSIVDQIKHMHQVRPDYYLGVCWFQIDPGDPRWDINGGYSAHRIPHIWETLYDWQAQLAGSTPPPPPVDPPPPPPVSEPAAYPAKATAKHVGGAVIYADKTFNHEVGRIAQWETVDVETVYDALQNQWRQIKFNGVWRWHNLETLTIEPNEPPLNIAAKDTRFAKRRLVALVSDVKIYKQTALGQIYDQRINATGAEFDIIPPELHTPLEMSHLIRKQSVNGFIVVRMGNALGFVESDQVTIEQADAPFFIADDDPRFGTERWKCIVDGMNTPVNIRDQPSVNGAQLGQLFATQSAVEVGHIPHALLTPTEQDGVTDSEGQWHVLKHDSYGVCYVAAKYVRLEKIPAPHETVVITVDHYNDLLQAENDLRDLQMRYLTQSIAIQQAATMINRVGQSFDNAAQILQGSASGDLNDAYELLTKLDIKEFVQ